jgi:alpha/beta superfamily hydrolase
MQKQRNRVNLTLDDEIFNLLTELSSLSDKPKATLINELLNDVKPHLEYSIELLNLLQNEKLTMSQAKTFFNRNLADVNEQTADLLRTVNQEEENDDS